MNPLHQIDAVFFYLKDKLQYGAYYGYNNIWFYIEKIPELEINKVMFREILDRLIEDGFISEKKVDDAAPVYNITFKGLLFDGYENEKTLSDQQKMIQESYSARTSEIAELNHRISSRMYYLTLILAIGTSIAAIYYLMEIARYLGWIPVSFVSLPGN